MWDLSSHSELGHIGSFILNIYAHYRLPAVLLFKEQMIDHLLGVKPVSSVSLPKYLII